MTITNALFIVGSPKARNSTSESLGNHVVGQLEAAGISVQTIQSNKVFRTEHFTQQFLNAYDEADLVLLAYPLYVDALPYLVTKALETMAAHRAEHPVSQPQRLACIGNCGFPEAQHLELSLEICREFAQETGMRWMGGLAIGEGGAIGGESMKIIAGRARNQIAALDKMAAALIADQEIPEEAIALAARPIIPQRLYTFMGSVGWHMMAHENEVRRDLHAQPYRPTDR